MSSPFEIQLTVANLFRIQAFRRSRREIIEDESTFSLVLELGYAPLYVKRYPLTKSHAGSASLLVELEREAKRFVDTGMTAALGVSPSYSVESGTVSALDYQQVVAIVREGEWWVARLVGKPRHADYYLLHWVGAEAHAELVVSAITSFELLESPDAGSS